MFKNNFQENVRHGQKRMYQTSPKSAQKLKNIDSKVSLSASFHLIQVLQQQSEELLHPHESLNAHSVNIFLSTL